MQQRHEATPRLTRTHTVTRTLELENTGDLYEAKLTSTQIGVINLRIGRHALRPNIWHLHAECNGERQKAIMSTDEDPTPLMLRMERFAEAWALTTVLPNLL